MRRALLAAGLAAAIALAAAAPCLGQPVAKLEVTGPSKEPALTQHQRIEAKLDQLLELVRGLKPATVDPQPPKPVDPGPPAPTEPAKPNPFVEWRAQGLDLVEIQLWRLGRGLTADELEQAYAAGYPRPGAPPASPGGGAGPTFDPRGNDFGATSGNRLDHTVAAGQQTTVRFTVPAGGAKVELWVYGLAGGYFYEITDTGPGFAGRVSRPFGSFHRALDAVPLPAGTYTYTFALDTSARVGIQVNQ